MRYFAGMITEVGAVAECLLGTEYSCFLGCFLDLKPAIPFPQSSKKLWVVLVGFFHLIFEETVFTNCSMSVFCLNAQRSLKKVTLTFLSSLFPVSSRLLEFNRAYCITRNYTPLMIADT